MIGQTTGASGVRNDPAGLRWQTWATCPSDWMLHVTQLGGGFFHSPAGLRLGAPEGESIFALLHERERIVGLAAGVLSRCRLSIKPRHFYAPSLPVVDDTSRRHAAVLSWREQLAQEGAAEALLDSYAGWELEPPLAGPRTRHEYMLSLEGGCERIVTAFADTHRRHLRHGQRQGWTLRTPAAEDAIAALRQVTYEAASRARLRADGFDPGPPTVRALYECQTGLQSFWGAQTFAAWSGEALLAAVLVGWANQRAYYILGGSTPEGYRRSAAVWLHWRVMGALAEHGCKVYNLGGTPASAARPEDPAHGLFRFKSGFGAETVACRGAQWQLRPGHVRAHSIASKLVAALKRSGQS